MYIYIYMYMYIYIFIYLFTDVYIMLNICVCIYMYVGSRTDTFLFQWVPIVPTIWYVAFKQAVVPSRENVQTHKKNIVSGGKWIHMVTFFIYYTCWITDWLVELEKVWHFHIFLGVAVCHRTCFGHGLELFATYSNTSPLIYILLKSLSLTLWPPVLLVIPE